MHSNKFMCMVTSTHLEINTYTMRQYVAGLATFKMMMRMLSNKLEKGAKLVYPDATEARVCFQKDVTTKYIDTIMDYQAWPLFATIDHCEDVEELVFPQLSMS